MKRVEIREAVKYKNQRISGEKSRKRKKDRKRLYVCVVYMRGFHRQSDSRSPQIIPACRAELLSLSFNTSVP